MIKLAIIFYLEIFGTVVVLTSPVQKLYYPPPSGPRDYYSTTTSATITSADQSNTAPYYYAQENVPSILYEDDWPDIFPPYHQLDNILTFAESIKSGLSPENFSYLIRPAAAAGEGAEAEEGPPPRAGVWSSPEFQSMASGGVLQPLSGGEGNIVKKHGTLEEVEDEPSSEDEDIPQRRRKGQTKKKKPEEEDDEADEEDDEGSQGELNYKKEQSYSYDYEDPEGNKYEEEDPDEDEEEEEETTATPETTTKKARRTTTELTTTTQAPFKLSDIHVPFSFLRIEYMIGYTFLGLMYGLGFLVLFQSILVPIAKLFVFISYLWAIYAGVFEPITKLDAMQYVPPNK